MTRRGWLACAGGAALLIGLGSYALRHEGGWWRWQAQHLPDLLHPLGLALICASVCEGRREAWWPVVAWVVVDALLECAQWAWPSGWQLLPGRFDPWDLLAIAAGGLLAALAVGWAFERGPTGRQAPSLGSRVTALRAASNR